MIYMLTQSSMPFKIVFVLNGSIRVTHYKSTTTLLSFSDANLEIYVTKNQGDRPRRLHNGKLLT